MAQGNQIKITVSVQDLASKALKDITNSAKDMGSSVTSRIAGMAKNIAKGVALMGAASATAFGGIISYGLKSAASLEQTAISFEVLLKDAGKAKKLMGQLADFAAQTPFEFPELADASKQLLAFGYNAEDILPSLKSIGELASGLNIPVGELAYLMGTTKTQGRLMTRDLMQFTQRGIPLLESLAGHFKVSTAEVMTMVEEGKIGFPIVNKMIKDMTTGSGKFAGMMVRQSKSLDGLISTAKDMFGIFARGLVGMTKEGEVIEGGIFDKLRTTLANFLEGGGPDKLIEWGQKVGKALTDMVSSVGSVISKFGDLKQVWLGLVEAVKTDDIGSLTEALFQLIGNEQTAWEIARILGKVGGMFRDAKDSIGAAIDSWRPIIVDKIRGLHTAVAPSLAFLEQEIRKSLGLDTGDATVAEPGWVTSVKNGLANLQSAWNTFTTIVQPLIDMFKSWFTDIKAAVDESIGPIKTAWNDLMATMEETGTLDRMRDAFKVVAAIIGGILLIALTTLLINFALLARGVQLAILWIDNFIISIKNGQNFIHGLTMLVQGFLTQDWQLAAAGAHKIQESFKSSMANTKGAIRDAMTASEGYVNDLGNIMDFNAKAISSAMGNESAKGANSLSANVSKGASNARAAIGSNLSHAAVATALSGVGAAGNQAGQNLKNNIEQKTREAVYSAGRLTGGASLPAPKVNAPTIPVASAIAAAATAMANTTLPAPRVAEATYSAGRMPQFAVGTPFVPRDMVAMIHKGEAIIPAKYNPYNSNTSQGAVGGAGTVVNQNIGDITIVNDRGDSVDRLIDRLGFRARYAL